jgi:hypothetical protein
MGTITVWARAILVSDIVFVGGQAYRVHRVVEDINDVWEIEATQIHNQDLWVGFVLMGTTNVRVIRGLSL